MAKKRLQLVRFADSPVGVFGELLDEAGNHMCYTCEPPDKNNKTRESCIPEGLYALKQRDSLVVERSSGGEFTRGWEVMNVPDRSFIMFHVGNTEDDTHGCILVGYTLAGINQKWAVGSSRTAFRHFMRSVTEDNGPWELEVRWKRK